MPNKRNRKDSTSSQGTGSSGSTGSSVGEDLADACLSKMCCFPGGCNANDGSISDAWVKIICNNENCTSGEFMHTECFSLWEDTILYHLKTQGRARNWSDKQRRQNLWTKKGYDLAYRACLCKCRKGYMKKDPDWNCNANQGGADSGDAKKKNRKKNKDLPVLANGKNQSAIVPLQRSKSKPIPSSSQARIRTNSTSSAISLDQGYISSSPCTGGGGGGEFAALFSPSSGHPWSTGRFNPVILQRSSAPGSQMHHAPSTSPLPELTASGGDDDNLLPTTYGSPHMFTPSPASTHVSLISGTGYSPPFSPDQQQRPSFYSGRNSHLHTVKESVISDDYDQLNTGSSPVYPVQPTDIDFTLERIRLQDESSVAGKNNGVSGFAEYLHSPSVAGIAKELKMQEEREMERKMDGKSVRSKPNGNRAAQTTTAAAAAAKAMTEIKLVPLRHTVFKQRFDFSIFQNVLPRQHVNPYHIKMEGEGYGSDDLRNFILSSLSMASCSQMNCVVCGIDMPVYDHFPLVDGTMFLSPERNERSTKRGVKITVEGKNEYVHAACLRCLEGLHNIVCKLCDARWQGSHHQLGTLYMYDIFAADPCCQSRLACKNCGNAMTDHRVGLKNFSDYSRKRQCQFCFVIDHHFVRPISTYQLVGVVFS